MEFEVLGEIRHIEAIATGRSIRIHARLVRDFGQGNWRKMKGIGMIRLPNGRVVKAELHWYEAHGIGKRKMKIKRYLK